jgi:hypothetical protein
MGGANHGDLDQLLEIPAFLKALQFGFEKR